MNEINCFMKLLVPFTGYLQKEAGQPSVENVLEVSALTTGAVKYNSISMIVSICHQGLS